MNMNEVKQCRHCGKYDYDGLFRWKNGRCMCRRCYRYYWQDLTGKLYPWDDLDGDFPSESEIEKCKDSE